MTRGGSVEIIENFWARVWQSRNSHAVDKLIAEDFTITSGGVDIHSHAEFKKWISAFLSSINDFRFEVIETFQNEDGSRIFRDGASLARTRGSWVPSRARRHLHGAPPYGRCARTACCSTIGSNATPSKLIAISGNNRRISADRAFNRPARTRLVSASQSWAAARDHRQPRPRAHRPQLASQLGRTQ